MTISSRKRGWRHLPRQWLFTDERLGGAAAGDPLWAAIARLPRWSGIVFRHYGWPEAERRSLLCRVLALARRRSLLVVVSGLAGRMGPGGRGDGVHRPDGARTPWRGGLRTAAAHGERQLRRAFRRRADLVFLSPVFETASHPGGAVLGARRFGRIARRAPGPVVALGGVVHGQARMLRRLGAHGYAGVDCWAGAAAVPAGLALGRRRL